MLQEKKETLWSCAVCGYVNRGSSKFCVNCGTAKKAKPKEVIQAKMTCSASVPGAMAVPAADTVNLPPGYMYGVRDMSVRHTEPVVIRSTDIDAFNLEFDRMGYSSRLRFGATDSVVATPQYPAGRYSFSLVREEKAALCRIRRPLDGNSCEVTFRTGLSALRKLDALLKQYDVAQLDGYAYETSILTVDRMRLSVSYQSGETIGASGVKPTNSYYRDEWFIEFFFALFESAWKKYRADSENSI